MNARLPTGTPLGRALAARRPEPEPLPLDEHVPNPGTRYGKAEIIRNTLLQMKGDDSFLIKDATQVYLVAKQLGIVITTRKTPGGCRVWRLK